VARASRGQFLVFILAGVLASVTPAAAQNPVPTVSSISPTSATAGGAAFTLTVNGSNFISSSVVRWNGSNRTTTFVRSTKLTASIPASDIATAGTAQVTVFNPTPGGGTSGAQTFTINNSAPTLSSIVPNSAAVGSGAFTLTVNGTNFVSGSKVRWNGSDRTTTFVSSTKLTAAILATDDAATGTAQVTVFNPTPGGGTSTAATFTITATNPVPTLSSISPNNATAGGNAFTLTVTGTNFVITSVVRWNGSNRTTTYLSATQLQAAISSTDIAAAGTASVTVFNPTPGGGTSGTQTFTINNPVPTLTSISPSSAAIGSGAFTLIVTGTNFTSGSKVRWNGSDRTTTYVSSTQLTAAILATDDAATGTAQVTVFNPTPGGGTSAAQTFTITATNPAPTLTSIAPSTATAGGNAFTLTVNGTNFVITSKVRWNGNDRTTTYLSTTQLQAAISASDIATGATIQVTVFNPTPGGGTSAAQTFTVNNPVPTLTSISPTNALVGSGALTLTVTGTNFVSGSVVRWNGSDRTTTFSSNTQLTAQIAATDVSTAGTAQVTVFTPTPGGGTSGAQTFTINNPAPTQSSISPSTAAAGSPAFTLTVTGTNFVSSSVVRWNGSNRSTTMIDSTKLTAQINAADVAAAGTAQVTVFTPAPGGGTSASSPFRISPAATSGITYVYDELGRLVGVVDPASDTAVYSYDAVGNLLGIARFGSSTASIIDFQPKSGPVATTVTIQGTGFSPTPSSNTVTFNGLSATITSATAMTLVVTVPSGASTGTIAVTSPAGSATSTSAFTVTATDGSPAITTFSPTVGAPGTAVTISGVNFESAPSSNKVSFYALSPAKAQVTSATTTSLVAVVPSNAVSGPLTVSTPGGTAVSSSDFFVPAGGYSGSQVTFTGRITVNGASLDVPLGTNSEALVLFAGTAGQRLDLGTIFVSGSGPLNALVITGPDGAVLATTGSSTARYLAVLPVSGTYTISLQNTTNSQTMRLTLSDEVTGTVTVGGSAVTVSIPRVGQRARLSFAGSAGEHVDAAVTFDAVGATVYFKSADDTTLSSLGVNSPGELASPALPTTGTYFFMIEPGSPYAGTFTVTLSDDVAATIVDGGASVPVSITRAGQRARVTFAGTAGQGPSLGITAATVSGAVTVYRPDGGTLLGPVGYSAPAANMDFPPLPATGNYDIVIDPSGIGTGSLTLTLSEPITGTITLDGSGLLVNITRPGQRAVLTFAGTAGHRVSHVLSGSTISGQLILMRSDGTVTQSSGLPSTTFIEPYTLPTTDTYYVIVEPSSASTGSTTIASYDVPPDVTGTLTINGPTLPVTISTPGQNALLSFSGSASQPFTVSITGNTIGCMLVVVSYAGGGSTANSSCTASFSFGDTMPTAGPHTLKIDPSGAATGGVTVGVTNP
jgi:YD repeat-containing protein